VNYILCWCVAQVLYSQSANVSFVALADALRRRKVDFHPPIANNTLCLFLALSAAAQVKVCLIWTAEQLLAFCLACEEI
jgi:hypothetical protein